MQDHYDGPPSEGERWATIGDHLEPITIVGYYPDKGLVGFRTDVGVYRAGGFDTLDIGEFAARYERIDNTMVQDPAGMYIQFSSINGEPSLKFGPYKTIRVTEIGVFGDDYLIGRIHPQIGYNPEILYEILMSTEPWKRYVITYQ